MDSFDWQERTRLLIKTSSLEKLKASHVLVAGLGGVGAYAAEMLCRAGVGKLTIADSDKVNTSNRNRQLLALRSTHGQPKVEIMARRLRDINPEIELKLIAEFLRDERTNQVLDGGFDYVIDAIDTLSPKAFFIKHTVNIGLPLVTSMGAGGKLDPLKVRVADFAHTYHCNLAKTLRKRLRKLGVAGGFKAVFSTEFVDEESITQINDEPNKKSTAGTISYMPAVFGCVCASVAIRDLLGIEIELEPPIFKRKSTDK